MVMASLHIEKDDSFNVSENNGQIMSQKLDRLNSALPFFSENNGLREHIFFGDIINKNLVGEFFIQDGSQMKNFSIIGEKSGGCEIIKFVVDVRHMRILPAVYVPAEAS